MSRFDKKSIFQFLFVTEKWIFEYFAKNVKNMLKIRRKTGKNIEK